MDKLAATLPGIENTTAIVPSVTDHAHAALTFAMPAGKLDADNYMVEDLDGITQNLSGSGNLNYLMLQARQNDLALGTDNNPALLRQGGDELGRYERALRSYADPGFWEAEIVEATPAYHDQGLIARAALDGRELFELHRD